jgi:hypothetical protein
MERHDFEIEELRRAAAAHIAARDEDPAVAEELARTARAAAQAGISLAEIDEIIGDSSREALAEPPLAA